LTARPRQLRSQVDQVVSLGLEPRVATIICDASIKISSGHAFQLQLHGPPGLEIENISMVERGVEQVARWSTSPTGLITVFLIGPTNGWQRLEIRGRAAVPSTGELTLTSFRWPNSEITSNELRVFGQSSALVEVKSARGMAPVAATETDRHDKLGRLQTRFTVEQPDAQITLKLMPNAPKIQGRQVTSIERTNDAWSSIIDFQIHVADGLLDQLRFDLPPQWEEPLQVERDIPFEIIAIPGENRKQLVLNPVAPISGEFRLRIRGAASSLTADRLFVPNVIPRGIGAIDRWLILPTQQQSQRITWETEGLTVTPLPPELQKQFEPSEGNQTYRVTGEQFQAQLKTIDRATRAARVSLADVQIAWHSGGYCYGVASFDVDATGIGQAVVNMPRDFELVHLTVGGLPTPVQSVGENDWRFDLGLAQLPQRIEAVFRGKLADDPTNQKNVSFLAPALQGLKAENTLWTIFSPLDVELAVEPPNVQGVNGIQQELTRLRSIMPLIESVTRASGEQDILRWNAAWHGRIVQIRGRALEHSMIENASSSAKTGEISEFNRDIAQIDERLGPAPIEGSRPNWEPTAIMPLTSAQGSRPVRYAFHSDVRSLDVGYWRQYPSNFGWRLLIAAGFMGLAVYLFRRLRMPLSWQVSPWRMTLAIAAFWWLFLAPSWIGFAVLVALFAGSVFANLKPRVTAARTVPSA
jgi:hypothetical protein